GVDVAEGKKDFSLGGFATEVGIGAVAGAVGGLAGKALAPVLSAAAVPAAGALNKTVVGRAVVAATSKVGNAFSNTVPTPESGIQKGLAKVATAAKFTKPVRPATAQPTGGAGVVLRDAEGATPAGDRGQHRRADRRLAGRTGRGAPGPDRPKRRALPLLAVR